MYAKFDIPGVVGSKVSREIVGGSGVSDLWAKMVPNRTKLAIFKIRSPIKINKKRILKIPQKMSYLVPIWPNLRLKLDIRGVNVLEKRGDE